MSCSNKKARLFSVLLYAVMLCSCTDYMSPDAIQQNADTVYGNISAEYDADSATHISLGSHISINGSGAELQKNVITIFREGTYILEGSLDEGQLIVDAAGADVRIVLNNAHITCPYSAAIYARNAANVIITLADGTKNALADADVRPSDDSIDGTVYSKVPIIINGSGSLAVSGAYKHGICSKENVAICGGSISISAQKTGLDSHGGITLASCSLNINSGTNGIRSGKENAAADIDIQSGTYSVVSAGDGIQSYGSINISDGTISVITGGGSAEAPVIHSEFSMNGSPSQSDETQDDTSRKGIKAAADITISGGSFTIDAYDDGMHSDGSLTFADGSCFISSGDDGMHAEGALLVSGGSIDIPYCFEGMEGMSVTVTDGILNIRANDDGINTAADETSENDPQLPSMANGAQIQPPGGTDFSQDFTPPAGMDIPPDFTPPEASESPQNPMPNKPDAASAPARSDTPDGIPQFGPPGSGNKTNRPDGSGGFGGMPNETPQDGVDITISGGTVTVSAEGDCMDSNGNIYITGGTVYVSTNKYPVIGSAEAGLDCNGSLTVSNGSLIGTGSSSSGTAGLKDSAIIYYGETTFDSGIPIIVSDLSGNKLFEFTPVYPFSSVLIASHSLAAGETYTLTIGDTQQEIHLTEQLFIIGESSRGFGGFNGAPPPDPPSGISSDAS